MFCNDNGGTTNLPQIPSLLLSCPGNELSEYHPPSLSENQDIFIKER
jgi:hypothetical protein